MSSSCCWHAVGWVSWAAIATWWCWTEPKHTSFSFAFPDELHGIKLPLGMDQIYYGYAFIIDNSLNVGRKSAVLYDHHLFWAQTML